MPYCISTKTSGGVCPILIWWSRVQLRLWLNTYCSTVVNGCPSCGCMAATAPWSWSWRGVAGSGIGPSGALSRAGVQSCGGVGACLSWIWLGVISQSMHLLSSCRSIRWRLNDRRRSGCWIFMGAKHLARRQLAFLHGASVAEDPTRMIRAARYGARLGFPWLQKRLSRSQTRWRSGHGLACR